MKQVIKQDDIISVLDALYGKSVYGIPKLSKPITDVADEYLNMYEDIETAAKKMLSSQIKKCTVSGFVTGLAGAIVLPVAVGADLSVSWYVQLRMIAGLAYIGGHNIEDDEVQTVIYACLAGVSVNNVAKKAGVQFGQKYAEQMIKRIPSELITKINQKVGYRFITKFGQKGTINLVDMIPGVGGVVSGGFNFAETKLIADRAYKAFIKGDISAIGDNSRHWFDFSANKDEEILRIKEAARRLGIRFENEYHQGLEFIYIVATEDELDDLLDDLPEEIGYKKQGKKQEKELSRRYKGYSKEHYFDVEYSVEENSEHCL